MLLIAVLIQSLTQQPRYYRLTTALYLLVCPGGSV